ncbi:MAG: hypothetical protein U0228_09915 [Myxococcaceae bacterium]
MNTGVAVGVAVGVLAYVALLGLIVFFAVRWSRSILTKKSTVLGAGLEGLGAKKTGEVKRGGLYAGTDVHYEFGGRKVTVNVAYVSRSYVKASVRVDTGPLPYAVLFPEKAVDRFGKVIGLNREVQTGDQAFDDACYVDTSEDDAVVKRLLESPEVRDDLKKLVSLGYKVCTSERGLELFQIVYALTPLDAQHLAPALEVLPHLAGKLPSFEGATLKGPGAFRKYGLAWLVFGAMFAGVMITGAASGASGTTVEGVKLVSLVLGVGGLAWVAFNAAVAFAVRGTSNAMRMLLVSAVVTAFGVPSGAGAVAVLLNQSLDGSAPTMREVKVLKLRCRRDSSAVVVDNWVVTGQRLEVHVSKAVCDGAKEGDVLQVPEHPGAFGIVWAERVK